MNRAMPINVAEAIIEPFWDPQISGLSKWRIRPGARHGLRVSQNWCWVNFEWMRRPAGRPALSMSRSFNIPCKGYDKLLVSVQAPVGSTVRLAAVTDKGQRSMASTPSPVDRREVALDLKGATVLKRLTIEIDPASDGPALGSFLWIGLQNSAMLDAHFAQWQGCDPKWDGHLKPASYQPKFVPAYELVTSRREIRAAQRRHAADVMRSGSSAALASAKALDTTAPEAFITDHLHRYTDTRYIRERDYGANFPTDPATAARAGIVLKDPKLLRLAARAALSMAACPTWDESFICDYPIGIYEHRCFNHTAVLSSLVAALDLAGEMFTDAGRDFLLRKIAEEGLGRTNFIVWKHDYIFRNNQLSAFSAGRILAYAVLERHWQHVTPYLELAYRELVENVEQILLPDGGYAEGPSYFAYGVGTALAALGHYARARGKTLQDVLPTRLSKTENFAACLGSTDESVDFVPFADGSALQSRAWLSTMALLVPEGHWTRLYMKAAARERGEIVRAAPDELPPFIALPNMGCLASHRRLGDEWVKIFVAGTMAGADHQHEDKGGFVLEFAGETFAMDPGTASYGNALATLQALPAAQRALPRAERPARAAAVRYVLQGRRCCERQWGQETLQRRDQPHGRLGGVLQIMDPHDNLADA